MHAGLSFSYSYISLLLRQPLSIKKSYAGAIQLTTNIHRRVAQVSPSYQCSRCHFSIRHGNITSFSSTFSCLNCCKCEERVSWQPVVLCAPCNGIMPRSIRTVYEDDIIARRFFSPALARSTPFNRAISCELKSLLYTMPALICMHFL
jgi:hypothetical protein